MSNPVCDNKKRIGKIGWKTPGRWNIFGKSAVGVLALSSVLASSQVVDYKTDVVLRLTATVPSGWRVPDVAYRNDCLFSGANGTESRPSRFAWGNGSSKQPYCGFLDVFQLHKNQQAIWIRRHVVVPDAPERDFNVFELKKRLPGDTLGRCLGVNAAGTEPVLLSKIGGTGPYCGWTSAEIMQDKGLIWELFQAGPLISYKLGKCLIFSKSGDDQYASLFAWGPGEPGGEDKYCKLEYTKLRAGGQGWFSIQSVRDMPGPNPATWLPDPYPEQSIHTLQPGR